MHWDRLARYSAPLGLIVLAAGTLAILGLLSRRRGGSLGQLPLQSDGTLDVKGTIKCTVYRRYALGGRTNVLPADEFLLPGRIQVRCKGEGDARRCTAYYPECPRPSPFVGDALPTAAARKKVSGLRPPEHVTRSVDNSGAWNTMVEWSGKEGWKPRGNERVREEFGIQVWDDATEVHYHAGAFRRPYPRAELEYERDGWWMAADAAGLRSLHGLVAGTAAARGVTRGGYVEAERLRTAPPIRIGGREIDWPREEAA